MTSNFWLPSFLSLCYPKFFHFIFSQPSIAVYEMKVAGLFTNVFILLKAHLCQCFSFKWYNLSELRYHVNMDKYEEALKRLLKPVSLCLTQFAWNIHRLWSRRAIHRCQSAYRLSVYISSDQAFLLTPWCPCCINILNTISDDIQTIRLSLLWVGITSVQICLIHLHWNSRRSSRICLKETLTVIRSSGV